MPGSERESRRTEARLDGTTADGSTVEVVVRGPYASEVAPLAIRAALRVVGNGPVAPKYDPNGFAGIIGQSAPIREVFRLLERVGPTTATVLITGENGTGKELAARALHDLSPRKAKRFVAVNCAAIPAELLESEFFGHKRGAFTGAVVDKPGLFEMADGGTFFMDEIGDMAPSLQVKLLRVLQEGTFMPVGGTETKRADVRVVAATNQDLIAMVRSGKFREDLYYRLNVVSLRLPPLREREGDIPLLVQRFFDRMQKRTGQKKRVSEGLLHRWMREPWNGNVRELENEVEKRWVLSGDDEVIGEDLFDDDVPLQRSSVPPAPGSSMPPPPPVGTSMKDAVEALERRMITEALERHAGNKTRAASDLGISRRNLIRKVHAYGFASFDEGDDEG